MRTRAARVVGLALAAACAPSGDVSQSQSVLSPAERERVADSVSILAREVMAAGETLDVDRMMAWFQDSPGAAFGGASGMVASAGELRRNLEAAYGGLSAQEIEPSGERVVVLASDAAVVTGMASFTTTDTLGNRAFGSQGYTFVWARSDEGWRILQAHFSSNLAGIETAGSEGAAGGR